MATKIQQKLDDLETQTKELLVAQNKGRANKRFPCYCGKYHTIKNCEVIQTHWYVQPRGCTDGDYWNEGELQIVCPEKDGKNRLLFTSSHTFPWEHRSEYDYDAQAQFKRIYKYLFKKVIDDYDTDTRPWVNNYYFDHNQERFEIKIKR